MKQLQKIAEDVGKEKINSLRKEKNLDDFAPLELVNKDSGKSFKLKTDVIYEIDRHNLFQPGHIEALQSIDKLIEDSIYIGSEKNEDNRNPKLKEFFYFGSGMKINGEDYTAKSVFVLTENGELYYDQSLSEIEKGLLIDILQKKISSKQVHPKKKSGIVSSQTKFLTH